MLLPFLAAVLRTRSLVVPAITSLCLVFVALPAGAGAENEGVARAREAREQAEQQVAAFQAQLAQATKVLEEGSARLAEKQAELDRTRAQQQRAQQKAQAALEQAREAREHLQTIVAATYRTPVPDSMQLALTASAEGIRDAVLARSDLDRVRGDSQDVLREATAARVEAEQAVDVAEQLTERAERQEREVAAEVERLRAYAQEAEQRLLQAMGQLTTAQAGERSAEEAARLAAARNAALLATCTSQDYKDKPNGFLDPSMLCPLDDNPGHALRPDAAAAFNAMNAEHKAMVGQPLCVTDSYRSYHGQVKVYSEKPHLAAVPGRSNHGWGLALDLGCGVERFGSAAHDWMRANAPRFGWYHPSWAQQNGSRPEAWHWEYAAEK